MSVLNPLLQFFKLLIGEQPLINSHILIPIQAFIFTLLTFNIMFELKKNSYLRRSLRFCRLFCGWLAFYLFYFSKFLNFTTIYLYDEIEPSLLIILRHYLPEEQKLYFKLALIAFTISFFLLILFENKKKFIPQDKGIRYHRSLKPIARFSVKSILGFLPIIALSSLFVFTEIDYDSKLLLIQCISIYSSVLFYQIYIKMFCLATYMCPSKYTLNKIGGLLIPPVFILVSLIGLNIPIINIIYTVLGFPLFSVGLSIIGVVYAIMEYRGISFKKNYQLNPHLRSIVSYPIAIQYKDKRKLNREAIYNAIISTCPDALVYYEITSSFFRETKAEIFIIDWLKYKEKDIKLERNNLHLRIINTLINDPIINTNTELQIVNFNIERNNEGYIKNTMPIKESISSKIVRIFTSLSLYIKKKTYNPLSYIYNRNISPPGHLNN